MPMPDGTYWVAKMGDKPVGGLFPIDEPAVRRRAGSLDVLSRRRRRRCAGEEGDQAAGAKLMRPIFDVPGVGRIAILHRAGRRRHRLDDAGDRADRMEELNHATHKVVSQDEWLAARKALLAKEKEFTKARDALSAAAARRCPGSRSRRTTCSTGRTARRRWPICSAAQPAHRLSLHARPGLEGRLPELLVPRRSFRRRRAFTSRSAT